MFLRALAHHRVRRSGLDIRAGFALARDPRTPFAPRLLALIFGVAITGLLIAFEAPLEAVFALLVPVGGEVADLVFDGLEVLILPLLIGAAILPQLVRRQRPRRRRQS